MKAGFTAFALALLVTYVAGIAYPIPVGLEPRSACGPWDVNIVYNILENLKATQFCTSWLKITTSTATVTTSTFPVSVIPTTTTVTIVSSVVTTTTTETATTTTVPSTVLAPTVTDILSFTITTTTPATSTVLSTSTSTSTLYQVDFSKRKRALKARSPQPSKLAQIEQFADGLVSSACSCVATTPIVSTTTTVISTTFTTTSFTIYTTSVDVVSTEVDISTDISFATSFITLTPSATISTTSTFTTPTFVATTTVVVPGLALKFEDINLTPIDIPGCVVSTYLNKISYSATSVNDAASQCVVGCINTPTCDEIFVADNLTTGKYDCYYLTQAQEADKNFVCQQSTIGDAAEYIIIVI